MASIERKVRVNINLRTAGVRQRTFSDLLLLGEHGGSDRVSIITGPDELGEAPFNLADTTALYNAAMVAFSQEVSPTRLFIGKRAAAETANAALAACAAENGEWYGVTEVTHTVADALPAAGWAEANNRLFGTVISQADAITTNTEDLASALKDGNFFRTHWWYHPLASAFPDVATTVKAFSAPPGGGRQASTGRQNVSDLFSERRLAAVPVVPMNETAATNVFNKNGNTFEPMRNLNLTQNGKTAAGEWIDIIRFRDWLCEEIRTGVFNVFVEQRVPYTDVGIAMIREAMVKALDLGVRRGGIAPETVDAEDNIVPSYTVTVPREVDISISDKAARVLRDVSFTARLAGAITSTEIVGVLTYDRIAAEAA